MPGNRNYNHELLEQARLLGDFKYKTEAIDATLLVFPKTSTG